MNWASHIDVDTGRPVETDNADHLAKEKSTSPAPFGGHNWHPMAFNTNTGLVYIPAMLNKAGYSTAKNFQYRGGSRWHMGQSEDSEEIKTLGSLSPGFLAAVIRRLAKGKLVAWDPVQQQEVWSVPHDTMWNGGVLTTATGLVFQGTGDGRFVAYDGKSGAKLWETPTTTGVIAPPISYAIDGEQYIAVMAGWGGSGPLSLKLPGSKSAGNGRLLVYKLGGKGELPPAAARPAMPEPPAQVGTEQTIALGAALYHQHCMFCHGVAANSGKIIADLRYLSADSHKAFQEIVRGGILSEIGMASFADRLSEEETEAIHHYIIDAARKKWEHDQASDWWKAVRNWGHEAFASVLNALGLL